MAKCKTGCWRGDQIGAYMPDCIGFILVCCRAGIPAFTYDKSFARHLQQSGFNRRLLFAGRINRPVDPAGTAGMAEMLVQNHEGYVEFLPCLPVEWKDGSFKGLCLKGGAEATAEWTNAVINKASLKATVDQVLKVKVPQGKKYRVLLNSKEAIANPDAKGLITVEMKRGDLLELL